MTSVMIDLLVKRLNLTSAERKAKQEECGALEAKWKSEVASMKKTSRMTAEDVDSKIESLEFKHAHSSHSNAEEKAFMREIASLKQSKKDIVANGEKQLYLDELKAQKQESYDDLQALRDEESNLLMGYKRLKLAMNAGVDLALIVEKPVAIPEDRLGAIIGKGGATLKKFEAMYNVSIDTPQQSHGGDVIVMGTRQATEEAAAAIVDRAQTISEELTLKDAVITTLINDKAVLTRELEEEMAVKIDIIKAKNLCKITGHASQLDEVRERILSLDCVKKTVDVDFATIPAIIGKGGDNLKRISSEHRVHLDVLRDAGQVVVTGERRHTDPAAALILSMFEELREIEDRTIKADKAIMMGAVIGKSGATVKTLQLELNVSLQIEKARDEDVTQSSEVSGEEILVIRGNKIQVSNAKAHIMARIGTFLGSCTIFKVPAAAVPNVVGKKGAVLNGIREQYPDATIDLAYEGGQISIHSPSAREREAIKATIERIVASNFVMEVAFEEDSMIALKGKRGADLRTMFNDMSLYVDMDATTHIVKIKGEEAAVRSACRECETFLLRTRSAQMVLTDDAYQALAKQGVTEDGTPSLKKCIEERFNVDVYVTSGGKDGGDEASLKIRGSDVDISAAKKAITGALAGDDRYGSVCVDLYSVPFSSIVGKGGASLRKLEKELPDAWLDLLKSKGQVRLRGPLDAGSAWVNDAKKRLLSAIDALRSAVTIAFQTAGEEKKIIDSIDTISAAFSVDIKKESDNSYIFRGDAGSVEEARTYMRELLSNQAVRKIPIGRHDVDAINTNLGDFFGRVQKKWNLAPDSIRAIAADARNTVAFVEITAPFSTIDKVKETVRKELERSLDPATFSSFLWDQKKMPIVCSLSSRESLKDLGLYVAADRPAGVIYITQRCDAPGLMNVSVGKVKINEFTFKWKETHGALDVEEWMITSIVGKGGSNINMLQEQTHSTIKMDRANMCLDVHSPDKQTLQTTMKVLSAMIEDLREGMWTGVIRKASLGAFLGKGGAHISKLRKETGASIELDKNSLSVKVLGTKEQTAAAKDAIMSFIEAENEKSHSVRFFYPPVTRSAIIGARGATIKDIEESTGCRLDLHKTRPEVTLSGSKESCVEGQKRLLAIITGAGFPADSFGAVLEEPDAPPTPVEEPEHTAEKGSRQLTALPAQPLSKSAAKRARKKLQQQKETEAVTTTIGSGEQVPTNIELSENEEEEEIVGSGQRITLQPQSAVAYTTQTESLPPSKVPYFSEPATVPSAIPSAPMTASQPDPEVISKVSIARNLIRSGMRGHDIALACKNFPYVGTKDAFIKELVDLDCEPGLAVDIAEACGVGAAASAPPSLPAPPSSYMEYNGDSGVKKATAMPRHAACAQPSVDPHDLTEQSSTADLLQALVGMGGGAGFKPIRQRRERESREGSASPMRIDVKKDSNPNPPDPQRLGPDREVGKKSAWAGWGVFP